MGMPVSSFSTMRPTLAAPPTSLMPALMLLGTPARPIRPGSPPPPLPPQKQHIGPFQEPELGFWNGLKTGSKAIVNSAVDTAAATVSLGQWDPDDVWDVDPVSDVGYDGARVFADIGTNVALATATGNLSGASGRIGQVARAVDRMDTVGNVITGVKGAYDATQNGLTLDNGAKMAMGLLGVAQAKSAMNAGTGATNAAAECATAVQGEIMCFAPDTLISTTTGSKPIGEVQPGEFVNAFDFASGEWVPAEVLERHNNGSSRNRVRGW